MNHRRYLTSLVYVAGFGLSLVSPAFGQINYQVGEGTPPANQEQADPNVANAPDNTGPVRMARFSFVKGNVTWRPDDTTDWAPASDNLPMRQGAQVWVADGGRAEVQFDDGSALRLGSGAVATLQTLYSDSQGEFTEIKLTDGLSNLDLRTDHSIYQIDTPHGSLKAVGPARVRVGVDEDSEIGVREGTATLEGPQGKLTLHGGDYVDVRDDTTPYTVQDLPKADSWDLFCDQRHDIETHPDANLPDNMKYVAGDLDTYGSWHADADYGQVWVPRVAPEWHPYTYGHWVWVDPFGWTWVAEEPWGWCPSHYGTWVHRGWGWSWVPGPVYQYWSPAVVSYTYVGGAVVWAPLAPAEVHYPATFAVGYYSGNWAFFFSIGACGVYAPYNDRWCVARPWNSFYVNHFHDHGFAEARFGGEDWNEHHFIASNARFGGATRASVEGFGGRGSFESLNAHDGEAAFVNGRSIGAAKGGIPMAGPARLVRPTATSWSATRTTTSEPGRAGNAGVINRPVYRGAAAAPGGGTRPQGNASRAGGAPGSASEAAAAARRSLGWPDRGGAGSAGAGSTADSRSQGQTSQRGAGSSRQSTSRSPSRGWNVPDHSGWTHSHTSPPAKANRDNSGKGH